MSVLQRVVKPTTHKGKKILLKKEPQLNEGIKKALFLKGRKTSEKIRGVLKDIYDIKKPDAQMLQHRNDITIFENATPVENFCKKYETHLFLMGSHSKKRPDNLVLGRMYNYSLLDMIELNVETYEGLKEFATSKVTLGTKPCLLFNGPQWDQSDELKHLKSIFIDMFHREKVSSVRLQGIEHTISFNVTSDGKIALRSYKVLLKKSGCRTPRIELEEIGPRIDFTLRRTKLPSEDLMKEACRQTKQPSKAAKKNISTDELGTTHGRIHLGKQEINNIQTRKMKGLKKSIQEKKVHRAIKRKALVENNNYVKKQKKT
ncbi:ribosome production factor 2 homolog [Cylas formicarius]|uniref:ribosome production factor 2 homolog n=1 Tax=Cylas formicarius TaxID=197179 RepID=UPI002958B45F|nr:ribosome production factor 2 homolog [Cylas formicarius]XP_060523855.1 ribosome production factor 2 homolog [Cylas formicarius]